MIDTYVENVGTVRECLDCGALVAGGPTRCIRCASECDIGPFRRWVITKVLGIWLPPYDDVVVRSQKKAQAIKRRVKGGRR